MGERLGIVVLDFKKLDFHLGNSFLILLESWLTAFTLGRELNMTNFSSLNQSLVKLLNRSISSSLVLQMSELSSKSSLLFTVSLSQSLLNFPNLFVASLNGLGSSFSLFVNCRSSLFEQLLLRLYELLVDNSSFG